MAEREVEVVYSHTSYRCTCPLPENDAHEIELARACAEREHEHDAALAALDARGPGRAG